MLGNSCGFWIMEVRCPPRSERTVWLSLLTVSFITDGCNQCTTSYVYIGHATLDVLQAMYALDMPHWMYFKLCMHWTYHTGCTSSYTCTGHATLDVLQAMDALDMPQGIYTLDVQDMYALDVLHVRIGHATRCVCIGCTTSYVCNRHATWNVLHNTYALEMLKLYSVFFTVNFLVYGANTKKKTIHICTGYAQSVSHSHYYILIVFIFFSLLTFW